MSKLHICYAIDDNYAQMCMLSIFDIISHKNIETELDFLILGDKLTKLQNFNKFNSIDKVNIKIKQLNSQAFIDKKDNKPNWYITGANRMRVIIPHLPEYKNVDKVLYLDADTFVTKDITQIFNINLENKPIGICKNPIRIIQGYRIMQTFGYIDKCHLLNSGVILFNIKRCKEIDFTKQCIEKMRAEGNSNEHVISEIFYDQVKLLPITLNFTPTMLLEPFPYVKNINIWNLYYKAQYKNIKDMVEQVLIFHFVGNIENTLANPHIRQIFEEAKKRLQKFFKTGKLQYSKIPNIKYYMKHFSVKNEDQV